MQVLLLIAIEKKFRILIPAMMNALSNSSLKTSILFCKHVSLRSVVQGPADNSFLFAFR